jgi:membrane-associated phospholipid phosphatase
MISWLFINDFCLNFEAAKLPLYPFPFMAFAHFLSTNQRFTPKNKLFMVLFGLILSANQGWGQTVFSAKKEVPIFTAGLLWGAGNLWFENNKVGADQFNRWKIRKFDKLAPLKLNKNLSRGADVAALLTGAAALLWVESRPKNAQLQALTILSQNALFTWNITQTSKMAFRRVRPYASAPGYTVNKKDDAYSFVSGHSSMVATTVTGMWLMNRSGTSKQRLLCTGAASLALGTACLRVAGGKHFTTDVLAGLLIGSGVAYVNHLVHR